jgi:hypothetical protein
MTAVIFSFTLLSRDASNPVRALISRAVFKLPIKFAHNKQSYFKAKHSQYAGVAGRKDFNKKRAHNAAPL